MAQAVVASANKKYEKCETSQYILNRQDKLVVCIIKRNNSPNPVIYKARLDNNNIFANDPVDIFWLKIGKGYIKKHRNSGKKDDRTELNYIETKLAYGIAYKKIANKLEYKITFNALSSWPCILKICPKDNIPKLFGKLNGNQCVLHEILVTMKPKNKSWFGLPSVDFMTLKGYKCDNNVYVEHRVKG